MVKAKAKAKTSAVPPKRGAKAKAKAPATAKSTPVAKAKSATTTQQVERVDESTGEARMVTVVTPPHPKRSADEIDASGDRFWKQYCRGEQGQASAPSSSSALPRLEEPLQDGLSSELEATMIAELETQLIDSQQETVTTDDANAASNAPNGADAADAAQDNGIIITESTVGAEGQDTGNGISTDSAVGAEGRDTGNGINTDSAVGAEGRDAGNGIGTDSAEAIRIRARVHEIMNTPSAGDVGGQPIIRFDCR